MNLSETIKAAREGLNMTQEDLAERCEVSRQAVSKWELGASAPSPENLALLSEILGIPLEPEEAAPETGDAAPAPAAGPSGRNPWKAAALALAGLMAAALLSTGIYITLVHPHSNRFDEGSLPVLPPAADQAVLPPDEGTALPEESEPAITGVWFCGEDGTPLNPDLGDGWKSFSTGQRVYLLVSFRQGTETGVQGVSLFATPTGTETYDQREQLALQAVYDRTFALFPLDFPENTMYHLDITLECSGGQMVTETLNVTVVSPDLILAPDTGENEPLPEPPLEARQGDNPSLPG